MITNNEGVRAQNTPTGFIDDGCCGVNGKWKRHDHKVFRNVAVFMNLGNHSKHAAPWGHNYLPSPFIR